VASTREQLAVAEDALERVQSQPVDVAAIARKLLADNGLDAETAVVARFALGRAQHEQGEIDAACRGLASTADEAAAHGLKNREAHIRGSLAVSLFTHGEADRAFLELAAAESALTGGEHARMVMQRAIILVHAGELTEGRDAFNQALPALVDAGDDLAVARLLISRGVVHSLLGDQTRAEADFLEGADRATILGQTTLAASAHGNVAFSYGRRGDIPAALEWFDRARRTYAETGDPGRYMAILDSDLCDVLLLAGLNEEATEAAMRALQATRSGGNAVDEAEAQLRFARCLLANGDYEQAEREATSAARLFSKSEREPWAAQAEYLRAIAAAAAGSKGSVDELGKIGDRLEQSGWTTEALHVRTLLGLALLEHGQTERAQQHFEAAALARYRGTAVQRAHAWHALAASRRATQNSGGALRALQAGLRVLDKHRMVLGATELRMRSGVHHEELVGLGLEIALENGRASGIFTWVELGRAGALRVPAARPPDNSELAERLAFYRALHQSNAEATLTGTRAPDDLRTARVEREISDLSRRIPGTHGETQHSMNPADLRARLGSRTLLEFFEFRGQLFVLTIDSRRIRHRVVGDLDVVHRHIDNVAFALRRLSSRPDLTAAARADSAAALASSAQQLDALLFQTVEAAADELIIVPSASLYRLAWSALGAIATRPITIAPSARVWSRPARRGDRNQRVTLVAGPGLDASAKELATLSELYPSAIVMAGEEAKVASVLKAISRAGVVHIAAHGSFRPASPQFSSLELNDGPLTLYDLEQLEDIPHTVVLASCNAASTDVMPGGEVMSSALALLAAGVDTVVAPIFSVPDETTALAMMELHQNLADGVPPAVALSRVATSRSAEDPIGATAKSFLTFGTDCQQF